MDCHQAIKVGHGHLFNRTRMGNASVIAEDIESISGNGSEHGRHLSLAADISLYRCRPATSLLDAGNDLLCGVGGRCVWVIDPELAPVTNAYRPLRFARKSS
jgi:hypothetical protein